MIKIVDYNNTYQEGIDRMMQEIASEFDEPIGVKTTNEKQTTLTSYWLALNDDEVVGTVGILVVEAQFAVLKSMMVKKEYRGRILGISNLLLKTAINWCAIHEIPEVYLGTMCQFRAAQSFYQKNGFDRILEFELPEKFIKNPLDTLFFKLDLTRERSL